MSLLTGGLVRMMRAMTGRGLLVGSCLLALLGTACTPSDPSPPPPTTVATPTPTENAQEREQRVAYEAAEKSYREFRAEFYRVLRTGGAKSATPQMKATAAGPYLKEATEVLQAYRGLGNRTTGSLKVSEVQGNGYTPQDLILRACEDSSNIVYFDSKGKVTGRGELRLVELTVREVDGTWKVWSGTGKKVSSCGE